MEFISNTDFYELSLDSIISDVDIDVAIELYQPIIGHKALALYLTLIKDAQKDDNQDIFSYENLFNRMQISSGDYLNAKNTLEAVGLIRTFLKKENDINYYIYFIYSPKGPKDFFSDILFKGLLVNYIGEKEARKLAEKYKIQIINHDNYEEITSSFTDVYNLDYNNSAFTTKINNNISERKTSGVKASFDYSLFFKYLSTNSQINKDTISDTQTKEIERIALLYGLNEETMADIVANSYNPNEKDNHIDFNHVLELAMQENKYGFLNKKSSTKSKITGDSELASKVKLMDSMAPSDYLRIKQNGARPAIPDLKLIEDLSSNFNLPNGVINALIDFVLVKQDNKLPRSYVEKIAAQLAREGVENAIDTMNYLIKSSTRKNTYNKNTSSKIVSSADKINKKNDKNEISDEEFQKVLDKIASGGK